MRLEKLNKITYPVFILLLVLAPLSKYPSISLPEYNFSAFRLGLYELIATVFILLCLIPASKKLKELFRQNRLFSYSLVIYIAISMAGILASLYKTRSTLLAISIIYLCTLVVCAFWYVKYALDSARYKKILNYLIIAGIVYGLVGIAQFFISTFTNQTLGILCRNCSSAVFGFPRINGFSAEPQFFANSLMPFMFIALGAGYFRRSKIANLALVLVTLTFTLTFSRGAFLSAFVGLILYFLVLLLRKQLNWLRFLKLTSLMLLGFVIGFVGLIASASYRYSSTPNITYNATVSALDQLTVGLINIPQRTATSPQKVNSRPAPSTSFIPSGLVAHSSNDRLEAAKLAIKAWKYSLKTFLIGVGPGNLGPFVDRHIDSSAPNNLTVYIYYVLIIAELGLVGLLGFLIINLSVLKQFIVRIWHSKMFAIWFSLACLNVAFLVQYLFFGTYINTVYVWVWLGVILGLSGAEIDKAKRSKKAIAAKEKA